MNTLKKRVTIQEANGVTDAKKKKFYKEAEESGGMALVKRKKASHGRKDDCIFFSIIC